MLLENVPMLLKYVPMLRFAGTIERDLTGILLGFRKNPRFINPCLALASNPTDFIGQREKYEK